MSTCSRWVPGFQGRPSALGKGDRCPLSRPPETGLWSSTAPRRWPGPSEKQGLNPKTGRGEAANNPRGTRQMLLWLAVGLQPRGPTDRRVSGQTVHRPSASGSSAAGDSCLLTLVTLPVSSPSGAWSTWRALSPGSTALHLRLSWCPDSRQLISAQPRSKDQSVNSTSCHHAPCVTGCWPLHRGTRQDAVSASDFLS